MPKRVTIKPGDVFFVPLKDGSRVLSQVLEEDDDLGMVSTVLFDIRLKSGDVSKSLDPPLEKAIGVASMTGEQLYRRIWRLEWNAKVSLPRAMWPNEEFRANDWVGAVVHDSLIIEDFLNAFYALDVWDPYLDPTYFDKMLLSPANKPGRLLFKKKSH